MQQPLSIGRALSPRIVEVYGQVGAEPAQWRCGSGYAIGGCLILTAAHVIHRDAGAASIIQVRRVGGELCEADLLWHGQDVGLDIALLKACDTEWATDVDRLPPIVWGIFATNRPNQRCEGVGFPMVVATPQRRDTEQISGDINPASMVKGRLLTIAIDNPPTPADRGTSPWSGISGTAILSAGAVVGIVAEDPAGWQSQRLLCVPTTSFLADANFCRIVAKHAAMSLDPEAVEFRAISHVISQHEPASPAALLSPEARSAPFRDRAELEELLRWCAYPGSWSARLVVGPGGQGKTRLAIELLDRMKKEGWVGFFVDETATDFEAIADLVLDALIVVDYAESRLEQLAMLVAHLHRSPSRVRLLLLARSTGDWINDPAVPSEQLAFLGTTPILRLDPLEPAVDGRLSAWNEAIVNFARRLSRVPGYDESDQPVGMAALAPPDLSSSQFENILGLQISALAVLLEQYEGEESSTSASPTDTILLHEQRYWTRSALARGLPFGSALQRSVVAAATVWGASNLTEAKNIVSHVPGLTELREHELHAASLWIAELYGDDQRFWDKLVPDRLAEHLISRSLDNLALRELCSETAAIATEDQWLTGLSNLCRAADYDSRAAGLIYELIVGYGVTAAIPAIRVASFTNHVQLICAALIESGRVASPVELSVLVDHLPPASAALANVSIELTRGLTAKLERLLDNDVSGRVQAEMARSQNNLANRLAEAGRAREAFVHADRAEDLYRRLASADRSYRAAHATALSTLAVACSEIGAFEGALRHSEAAVAILADPSTRSQQGFQELLGIKANHSSHLFQMGRRSEAVAQDQNTVMECREHVRDNPKSMSARALLAQSLGNLAISLQSVGTADSSNAAARECVTIWRGLAHEEPDRYGASFAGAAGRESDFLVAFDKRAAVKLAREAAESLRQLFLLAPDMLAVVFGEALQRLSDRLARLGLHTECIAVEREGVKLFEGLTSTARATYRERLAWLYYSLAHSLDVAGDYESAREADAEVMDIYRELCLEQRGEYLPRLAELLYMTANDFLRRGRIAKGLELAREAVPHLSELSETERDPYLFRLAIICNNIAVYVAIETGSEAAIPWLEMANNAYRRHVQSDPVSYRYNAASALRNLAAAHFAVGNLAEFVSFAEMSVGEYLIALDVHSPQATRDAVRRALSELSEMFQRAGRRPKADSIQRTVRLLGG